MERTTGRLVLDIGNSRTKAGLFAAGRLVRTASLANGDLGGIRAFVASWSVDRVVVGVVAAEDPGSLEGLQSVAPVQQINGRTPSHLHNAYLTPETLGADRWANAVGASVLFPDRAVLAISLGTCIIYDLVDGTGTYRGGIISPGARMRAQAMHVFTARLPVVEVGESPALIGRSTEECMASGVHHGIQGELVSVISTVRQQHPAIAVVITGGDGLRFARALENGIFAHPFLTLIGLHALSCSDLPAADVPSAG